MSDSSYESATCQEFNQDYVQCLPTICNILTQVPLVLVHGMAAGVAYFSLNVGDLSAERDVYAFDLPGFARSSRPQFSKKPREVEKQYVDAIEEWRKKVEIKSSDVKLIPVNC